MLLFYVVLCVFHCVVLFFLSPQPDSFNQNGSTNQVVIRPSTFLEPNTRLAPKPPQGGLFIDLRTFLVDFGNILDKCLVFLLMIFEKCSKPFYVLFLPFLLYCCARLPEHRFSS